MSIFTMITSQTAARAYFVAEIKPDVVAHYGKDDIIALNEAFNDWVDAMVEDGQMPKHAVNWSRT